MLVLLGHVYFISIYIFVPLYIYIYITRQYIYIPIYASILYQWLQMAEIAAWCLQEDPVERPEMRDIVGALPQIVMSSIEWEASLGGNSQVFSGLFDGR